MPTNIFFSIFIILYLFQRSIFKLSLFQSARSKSIDCFELETAMYKPNQAIFRVLKKEEQYMISCSYIRYEPIRQKAMLNCEIYEYWNHAKIRVNIVNSSRLWRSSKFMYQNHDNLKVYHSCMLQYVYQRIWFKSNCPILETLWYIYQYQKSTATLSTYVDTQTKSNINVL